MAVITDNDGDYKKNCIEKYKDFDSINNIRVFFETDNSKYTFEAVLFSDNTKICEEQFKDVNSMISHKTESAYKLLSSSLSLNVPQYIKDAIQWIRS